MTASFHGPKFQFGFPFSFLQFSVFTKKFPWYLSFSFKVFLKKNLSIYLFLERGEGKEKEGEKHQCVVASYVPPTRDPARNPGMCPDWELNQWPFGSQACTQSTEPHQPGLQMTIFIQLSFCIVGSISIS